MEVTVEVMEVTYVSGKNLLGVSFYINDTNIYTNEWSIHISFKAEEYIYTWTRRFLLTF